jgi:type IV secretory pathway TrbD component
MVWIVVAVGISFMLLMALSLCRAAALGDRQLDTIVARQHQQTSSHMED